MSPVDPRPEVMGTIGVPSIPDLGGLRFFPKMLALSVLGAKKPPTIVPTAERKERRFPSNLSPICSAPFGSRELFLGRRGRRIDHQRAADDFDQRIAGNPFDRHA